MLGTAQVVVSLVDNMTQRHSVGIPWGLVA